jgi:hypothetical protein
VAYLNHVQRYWHLNLVIVFRVLFLLAVSDILALSAHSELLQIPHREVVGNVLQHCDLYPATRQHSPFPFCDSILITVVVAGLRHNMGNTHVLSFEFFSCLTSLRPISVVVCGVSSSGKWVSYKSRLLALWLQHGTTVPEPEYFAASFDL